MRRVKHRCPPNSLAPPSLAPPLSTQSAICIGDTPHALGCTLIRWIVVALEGEATPVSILRQEYACILYAEYLQVYHKNTDCGMPLLVRACARTDRSPSRYLAVQTGTPNVQEMEMWLPRISNEPIANHLGVATQGWWPAAGTTNFYIYILYIYSLRNEA